MSARPAAPERAPFVDLRPAEAGARGARRDDLFLGRLAAPRLRADLEEAGILAGLEARGYANVSLRTNREDGEHRLRLVAPGIGAPLVDVRLAERSALVTDPPGLRFRLEVFSFLAVHDVVLQDPRGAFTADRPRLPGQGHPGLGLLGRVLDRLRNWAEDWGKDGLLVFPPHYHGAVMLEQRSLRFLSPARQGRFDALRRDTGALSLAEAAGAVAEGRVVDDSGAILQWTAAEMAAPLGHHLHDLLDSKEYAQAAQQARDAARYRFSPPHASQGQIARSSRKL